MLLTLHNIAFYLMDKGLLDPETIVRGEWTVHNRSARNQNFATNLGYNHHRYLVKQARGFDREKTDSLRIEATCYWLANNDEQYSALQRFLPRYYDFDQLHSILVTELMADMENLLDFFLRTGHWGEVSIAQRLGELLASYHSQLDERLRDSRSFSLFQKQKPWIFNLVQQGPTPENVLPPEHNAERQLLDLISRNNELKKMVAEVESIWQISSLFHGDVKFNNFLIRYDPDGAAPTDIRLIDWELADVGDPLWDVAAVFSAYLAQWVQEQAFAQQGNHHPLALASIQPAMAAFWAKYSREMSYDEDFATQALMKATRFLGVKLIYSCFENTQKTEYLSPFVAKLLQVAFNVLKSPERAVADLIGIQSQEIKTGGIGNHKA